MTVRPFALRFAFQLPSNDAGRTRIRDQHYTLLFPHSLNLADTLTLSQIDDFEGVVGQRCHEQSMACVVLR